MGRSLTLIALLLAPASAEAETPATRFRMEQVDVGLKIGYAVLLADVQGDGKKDIIVADAARVIWYENPTWKRRTILEGQTKPDNVCIDGHDIDGDGKLDLVLGAGWQPSNTRDAGTLQWLKRGPTLDDPWTLVPIGEEPSVHRIRFADLDGNGKPELIVGPLMGRDSTKANNWTDGQPLRLLSYSIPKDPARDRWTPEVIDQSLHVMHNFWPVEAASGKGMDLFTASYEGVNLLQRQESGKWVRQLVHAGNQASPKGSRGASEIKVGKGKLIATIEPWHGNEVVVYRPGKDAGQAWERRVIDNQLKWGHGVWWADLNGDGADDVIIGVRDDLSQEEGKRRGVRVYYQVDGPDAGKNRHIVENGGVAVEDLAAADLNGDGKIDIVAVGRQTGNVRIYWNEGVGK